MKKLVYLISSIFVCICLLSCKTKNQKEISAVQTQLEEELVEQNENKIEEISIEQNLKSQENETANLEQFDDYLGFYYSPIHHLKYTLSRDNKTFTLQIEDEKGLIKTERFSLQNNRTLVSTETNPGHSIVFKADKSICFSLYLRESDFQNYTDINNAYDSMEDCFSLADKNKMNPDEGKEISKHTKYFSDLLFAYYRDVEKVPVRYGRNYLIDHVTYDILLDGYYWEYSDKNTPPGLIIQPYLENPIMLYLYELTSRHDPAYHNMDIYSYVNGKWILDNSNPLFSDIRKIIDEARKAKVSIDLEFQNTEDDNTSYMILVTDKSHYFKYCLSLEEIKE